MKKNICFLVSLVVSTGLNFAFARAGIFNVVSQLFYIPILLAVVYYKKRGIYIAAGISMLYFGIDTLVARDSINLVPALVRVFVFVAIAVMLYFLNERHNKTEYELNTFFNINADMMCCTDQRGHFLKVNQAFEEVLGYTTDELINRRFFEFIHPDDIDKTTAADQQLKDYIQVKEFINRYRCKDGTYKYIEWRSFPLNELVYSTARDVTNRELAERLRASTIARYESLQKISGYESENEHDLLRDILAEAIRLTESRQGHIFYCDEKSDRLSWKVSSLEDPDGQCPFADAAGNSLLREVIQKKRPVFINDAEQIRVRGFCFLDKRPISNVLLVPVLERDAVVSVIGVYNKKTDFDETDNLQLLLFSKSAFELVLRRRAEHALLSEKTWLETTLLSIKDGIIATDQTGSIRTVNSPAQKLAAGGLKDIIGKNVSEVYTFERKSDHSEMALSINQSPSDSPDGNIGRNLSFVSENGDITDLDIDLSEIKYDDQSVLGYLFILRDVTQMNRDEREILFLTYHDKLTGLYNRRFFEEEIKRLDVDRRYPLSIIMGDVNGLKLTNDAFGHLAGDELLAAVAHVIKEVCRKDDIASRWGGDEYGILLPNTDAGAAADIANRIKKRCSETFVSNIHLSISLGTATKSSQSEDMMDILKRADDLMYKSKLLESRSMKSSAVKTILRMLYEKNPLEEKHSTRVSMICKKIGLSMELSKNQINDLELLGKIHDIGKISVDKSILNRKELLTPEEYEAVKRHSESGYHIINASPELSYLANYVLYHHERWDGTGYPNGLKAKDIPLFSRILCVADAFEAMTSDRSYRKSLSHADVIKELERCSGSQFDPNVLSACLSSLNSIAN